MNNPIIRRLPETGNALRGEGFYTLQTPSEEQGEDLTFLATSYAPKYDGRIDKYFEGYSTIQLMTTGGVELSYGDTTYVLEGAWFWPHHPGPRIRFRPTPAHPTWFHRHIGFCGPRVDRWVKSGLWPDRPQPAPPGRDWGAYFDEMIRQAEHRERWGYLRAINLLECLLLDLADARTQSVDTQEAWLMAVTGRLSGGGAFVPDYASIAREVGMTLSMLRRRFRRATGMTMQEYVLQTRLAAARSLLVETDLPLKAISERLGYDTVHFFARQFRQRVGVTPGLYRKSR